MQSSTLMAEDIAILRDTIRANDGANVAGPAFARKVDALISGFYDGITEITDLGLQDILDLFLIKVLYVERHSRDAATLDYIGHLLSRYLQSEEMSLGNPSGSVVAYLSSLLEEVEHPCGLFRNLFEAYRKYGDNSLFISGVFPNSLGRKRSGGMLGGGGTLVDRQHLIDVGRRYYEMAAGQDLAERLDLRTTLRRLAQFFDVYVEALNEMSDRYVMGMDVRVITDKMLDAFNLYRKTQDERHLLSARRYSLLLRLDGRQWPALDGLQLGQPSYY